MADGPPSEGISAGFAQRLYVRFYLALVASLTVATGLFAAAHMFYDPSRHAGPGHRILLMFLGIGVVVAAAAYPVVRRLTRRLERLQKDVDAWGEGRLSVRVAVEGRDEVARVAASFNRAAGRIEALVGAQKSLLANASHELRSPLARLRMASELLQAGAPQSLRDELARNIAELDQLIDELLLASRLDATAETARALEAVDLTAMLAEECARADVLLSAPPRDIQAEPKLLRRMIRNLLENAGRHGAAPIEIGLSAPAPDRVCLDVCDRGPGVPEGERELIFTPFYRRTGASEADGSVGLGLSLVRQIARRHGGDAICLPREGGGACFRVTLPACPIDR
jgi:two-component system OmpR family sensor kinase